MTLATTVNEIYDRLSVELDVVRDIEAGETEWNACVRQLKTKFTRSEILEMADQLQIAGRRASGISTRMLAVKIVNIVLRFDNDHKLVLRSNY